MRVAHLRVLRERAFLTQRELAQQTGISIPTLSRLEQGNQEARLTTIRKLARALHVEPSALTTPEAAAD